MAITYSSYRINKNIGSETEMGYSGGGSSPASSIPGIYMQKTGDSATGNYFFNTNLLCIDNDNTSVCIGKIPDSASQLFEVGGNAVIDGWIQASDFRFAAPGDDSAGIRYSAGTGDDHILELYVGNEETDIINLLAPGNNGVQINGNAVYHSNNANKNDIDWTARNLTLAGVTRASGCVYIQTANNFYNQNLRLKPSTAGGYASLAFGAVDADDGTGPGQWTFIRHPDFDGNRFSFRHNGDDFFTILTDGKIGVDRIDPAYALDVYGTIRATSDLRADGVIIPSLGNTGSTGIIFPALGAQNAWIQSFQDVDHVKLRLGVGNTAADRVVLYQNGDDRLTVYNSYIGLNIGTPTYPLHVVGNAFFNDYVYTNTHAGTPTFVSGFAGSGWKMDWTDSTASLTVDNLVVRKAMDVYELRIKQIRATNGSIWVSDACKLAFASDQGGGNWYVNIDTADGSLLVPFVVNDIIRCQKWNGRSIKYYSAYVTWVGGGANEFALAILDGAGTPAAGDELVRVGNLATASRQGAIYLTSSDSNNPYIDVLDGVNTYSFAGKTKARLGNLTGISDAAFGGALSGYGLYSSNVYLNGKIIIASGSSGYANMSDKPSSLSGINATEGTKLTGIAAGATVGADWTTNLANIPATLATPSGAGLYLSATAMGYYDGGAWKTYIDNTGTMLLGNIGTGGQGLYWDQGGGTLTVSGSVLITNTISTSSTSAPSTAGLYMSSQYMGYWNGSAWKTCMNNLGDLFLGDIAGGNVGLSWTQATGALAVRGVIYANSGLIGSWNINATYLARDTGTAATSCGMAPEDYPVYAGATYANRATAPFRVTTAGVATMTNATIQTNTTGQYIKIDSSNNTFKLQSSDSVNHYVLIDDNLEGTIGRPGIKCADDSGTARLTGRKLWLDNLATVGVTRAAYLEASTFVELYLQDGKNSASLIAGDLGLKLSNTDYTYFTGMKYYEFRAENSSNNNLFIVNPSLSTLSLYARNLPSTAGGGTWKTLVVDTTNGQIAHL